MDLFFVVSCVLLVLAGVGGFLWVVVRRERRTIQQAQDRKRAASKEKRSASAKAAAAAKKKGNIDVGKMQPGDALKELAEHPLPDPYPDWRHGGDTMQGNELNRPEWNNQS